jgi:hypothetical protein
MQENTFASAQDQRQTEQAKTQRIFVAHLVRLGLEHLERLIISIRLEIVENRPVPIPARPLEVSQHLDRDPECVGTVQLLLLTLRQRT